MLSSIKDFAKNFSIGKCAICDKNLTGPIDSILNRSVISLVQSLLIHVMLKTWTITKTVPECRQLSKYQQN